MKKILAFCLHPIWHYTIREICAAVQRDWNTPKQVSDALFTEAASKIEELRAERDAAREAHRRVTDEWTLSLQNEKQLEEANYTLRALAERHYTSQAWYARSLEVLRPLRFHMAELLQQVADHNRAAGRLGHLVIPNSPVEAATAALKAVEDFFTKPVAK